MTSKPDDVPQTTIPGAMGSIFDPHDRVTGESVPTMGRCVCGNDDVNKTTVTNHGTTKVRICSVCGAEISGVRKR